MVPTPNPNLCHGPHNSLVTDENHLFPGYLNKNLVLGCCDGIFGFRLVRSDLALRCCSNISGLVTLR